MSGNKKTNKSLTDTSVSDFFIALLGVLVYNEAIKGEKPYSMGVISAVKLELVFAFFALLGGVMAVVLAIAICKRENSTKS